MPTYIFRNTKTEEITEEFMTFSAREEYLKNNPELAIVIQSPMMFRVSLLQIQKQVKCLQDLVKYYLK